MPLPTPSGLAPCLRLPAVAAILGVHPTTVTSWVKSGQFPKPIKLSSRCHVWNQEAVESFVKQQQEQLND